MSELYWSRHNDRLRVLTHTLVTVFVVAVAALHFNVMLFLSFRRGESFFSIPTSGYDLHETKQVFAWSCVVKGGIHRRSHSCTPARYPPSTMMSTDRTVRSRPKHKRHNRASHTHNATNRINIMRHHTDTQPSRIAHRTNQIDSKQINNIPNHTDTEPNTVRRFANSFQ